MTREPCLSGRTCSTCRLPSMASLWKRPPSVESVGRLLRFSVFFGVMLCLSIPAAYAQYFGQNKVQYQSFDFKIIKTSHFDIFYYPEERETAVQAARMAERWYARLSQIFKHKLQGRQPLILYASHPAFEQTNAISGALGEGTGGVTEALKRRIVLPVGNTLQETDHVIGHELVHAFQYDMTRQGDGARVGFNAPSALALPLWFIEGMAEYLSIGPVDPNTAMWMRDATLTKLPDLKQLEDPRFFPYRYGQSLIAYIAGRWGDQAVGQLLKEGGKRGDIRIALRTVLKLNPDKLVEDWHAAIREAYDPLKERTQPPASYGRAVFSPQENPQDAPFNVSPVLSPDGARLLVISSKSFFSLDIFVFDVKTGKPLHKLTSTALDPHFESLQFIYSAGAWDADGRRIAFGAVSKGHPVLSIYDLARGETAREIRVKGVDEIFTPTWSPDGRYVAFSGLSGGHTDLFIYDLETDGLRRVTNDLYADLHPAWSPDGRSIVFVTERFTTSLPDLRIGAYRLGLLDPVTGDIRPLPALRRGKHINPQWSPDGAAIYFISDATGISNVYRLNMARGAIERITNLFTGVSGITGISPAISVAQKEGSLIFSAYEKDQYVLYTVEPSALRADASAVAQTDETGSPDRLPPARRGNDQLTPLLDDPETGLPDVGQFAYTDYKAGLQLDFVGQPYLAAGTDRFGTFIGGGTALFWSDLLGNHNLVTALQIFGSFDNIDALVGYTNLRNRWNWGVAVQQTPFITGNFGTFVSDLNGQPVLVEQQNTFRQTNRQVVGIFQYPFSRASRFEATTGYQFITLDEEQERRVISLTTGEVLAETTTDFPTPDDVHLVEASAAYVYDQTFFGVTGPILGQRYRIEARPIGGSLTLVEALADYRRYVMPVRPYTIAARVLHLGRYGPDSEDNRVTPLFLGYPGLVRGYDFFSLEPDEGDVANQLFGSRLAVANFELRMPLYHILTLGRGSFYGYLPIEVAGFYDAGVAWTSDAGPFDRNLIQSFGVATRMNLGGAAVLELDWARPIDRSRGWEFQFSLTPGF